MPSLQSLWRSYCRQGGTLDSTSFAVWLIRHQPTIEEAIKENNFPSADASFPVRNDSMAAIFIGRLERFAHLKSKHKFREFGISTPDEFGLLATLFFMGRTTKTRLLRQCLMELTTGSQMLKRLKGAGWLLEKANPGDGRSSFIELSAQGMRQLGACFHSLESLDPLLEGLSLAEQEQLLSLLDKLDQVHSQRHQVSGAREMMEKDTP